MHIWQSRGHLDSIFQHDIENPGTEKPHSRNPDCEVRSWIPACETASHPRKPPRRSVAAADLRDCAAAVPEPTRGRSRSFRSYYVHACLIGGDCARPKREGLRAAGRSALVVMLQGCNRRAARTWTGLRRRYKYPFEAPAIPRRSID